MESKKQTLARILTYILITFGLTWVYCLLVVYPVANGEILYGVPAMATQLLVAAAMFFPAIGVLLTRLLTKEGFRGSLLKPNFKKNIRYYLLSWFGPGILTFAGAALYFVIFRGSFDPDCGYMRQTMAAAGAPYEAQAVPMHLLMLIQTVQALFLAPVLNFITCFGEEWGWRGYLLPKMSTLLPTVPMLLINGIIWGLWHAPMTIIGHNYGVGYPGFPFTGIAMVCLFCIVLGVLLSYVTLKTNSCIPAVLGHGAINGIGAIGMYFTIDGGNPFIGPAPTGFIGMIPFMIVAVFMVISLSKKRS